MLLGKGRVMEVEWWWTMQVLVETWQSYVFKRMWRTGGNSAVWCFVIPSAGSNRAELTDIGFTIKVHVRDVNLNQMFMGSKKATIWTFTPPPRCSRYLYTTGHISWLGRLDPVLETSQDQALLIQYKFRPRTLAGRFGSLTDSHGSFFEFDSHGSSSPLKHIGFWNSLPRELFCRVAIALGGMCKWSQHVIRQICMALEEKLPITRAYRFLTATVFLSHLTMWHRISSEPSLPQPHVQ